MLLAALAARSRILSEGARTLLADFERGGDDSGVFVNEIV
jgi:hypothetical protein